MLSLFDACHIFGDSGLPKNVEPFENALVGEVLVTVAVATVLLYGLLEGTLLGDMPLLVAVVAEAVAASASKERTLYWASTMWGQWHPIFGHRAHRGVGKVSVSNLLQCLYLFHPALYSTHLHIHHEQGS